MKKIIICSLWALLGLTVLAAVLGFTAIEKGWIGYMPPVEDMQNPINRFATQVYSADGKILGTWNYNRENRIMVDYNQLSPALIQALVATEDVRFYDHSGIDFYALGRAIVKRGIFGQKSAGGGSTITQQLAKQLYSEKAHSVMERLLQKPIEWVIAVKLERNYTKDEIITMYLNYFDFLHNAVGIKTASNTYFSKDPKDLKVTEAAVLVGLCKNPSYFNPVRHPERSLERRNVVLSQMEKAGYISETERDSMSAEPLNLKFHVADHKDGIAQYFRDFLRRYMMAKKPERKDYFEWSMVKFHIDSINWENDPLYGWCNKNKKKDGEPYNVYTDGLKVYTTIDSRMQQYAEKAVYEHVAKFLQPAFTKEKKGRKTAPFSGSLSVEQVNNILMRSVRQCDRYRAMKASGASEDEIMQAFRTKTEMTVFS
jgi:penicillin-binding protein 1A